MSKSAVVIGQYFVKICKTVWFDYNVQEIVVLYFGRFFLLSQLFLITLCQESPQMVPAKFGANR